MNILSAKRKLFLSLFAGFFFLLPLSAQTVNIPMVKCDKKITAMDWSKDSQSFAYTDGQNIIIRKSSDFSISQTIITPYLDITELFYVSAASECILIATESGIIEIRELSVLADDMGNLIYQNYIILELGSPGDYKLTALKCSEDASFIAAGYENGSLKLFNYNEISGEYVEESYEIEMTAITSIDINPQADMLLTISEDGSTRFWNINMEEIEAFSFYSTPLQKVYFVQDYNSPLITTADDYSLSIFDLNANPKANYLMSVDETIISYRISKDRKIALILDAGKKINVFEINNAQFTGFIPNFSTSSILDFQIDSSQTKFLILHEDNTIFILETKKALFPKNAALPQTKIVQMDSPDALAELMKYEEEELETEALEDETAVEEAVEEESEEEEHKYEALAMIRYKNTDAVSFRLKLSVAPGPYVLGLGFASGYTAYKLIQPFYFGGFIEPHIGFPQKEFPYKYELHGSSLSSPLIIGGKIYVPFGICVYPFQQNIEFFVDIAPGLVFNMLWNTKFGKDAISSKLFTGFYGVIRTGASFKNFSAFLEATYDAVLGFGVSLGVSYSIPISYTSQIEEAPKSLE